MWWGHKGGMLEPLKILVATEMRAHVFVRTLSLSSILGSLSQYGESRPQNVFNQDIFSVASATHTHTNTTLHEMEASLSL